MARSLEEIVRDQLGGMAFLLCQKEAELEMAKDKIKQLEAVRQSDENKKKE
jgi:hypothetical protein